MPTRTILGGSYPTGILFGKEWMLKELAYPSLGELSGGGAAFGRLYSWTDCDTIRTLLADGWRIPEYRVATATTEWQDLFVAAGIAGTEGKLRNPSLTYWAANPNGVNLYGFDLRGAGTEGGGLVTVVGRYWYLNNPGNAVGSYNDTRWYYDRVTTGGPYVALSTSKCSLRLVRDAPAGFSGVLPAQSGAWRNASEVHVAKDGVWRKANRIFVPVSGAWREVL